MKTLNKKIMFRMNLISGITVTLIVLLVSGYHYFTEKKKLFAELDHNLTEELNDFSNYIDLELELNNKYSILGLNFFEEYFNNQGQLNVSKTKKIRFEAVNQITKQKVETEVPAWYLNGVQLQYNTKYVDHIQQNDIATATIFQRIPEGFLRISTNVLKNNGERAVGTFIPNSSPVAQTIMAGKDYTGRAYVVNDWYVTAYRPLVVDNKIEGAIYVGQPEKDLTNLKSIFYNKHFLDSGYPYLVSKAGTLIIHPNNEGEDVREEEFFIKTINSGSKTGRIEYTYKGEDKIHYFQYIEKIDSYLAASIYKKDVYNQVSHILYVNIIATVLAVLIFILANRILSKSIVRGLQKKE
jgi:methyl-accepting chemotaxis protein